MKEIEKPFFPKYKCHANQIFEIYAKIVTLQYLIKFLSLNHLQGENPGLKRPVLQKSVR